MKYLILIAVALLMVGCKVNDEELGEFNVEINCTKTDLWTIGGYKTEPKPIYDCSNLRKKQ